ncbi:hypothetical protein CRUP_030319 [Coryphaenoides rupestris]|nr:hypothetical protein CRUP_030319 [Coryphaenoides rupestris]
MNLGGSYTFFPLETRRTCPGRLHPSVVQYAEGTSADHRALQPADLVRLQLHQVSVGEDQLPSIELLLQGHKESS